MCLLTLSQKHTLKQRCGGRSEASMEHISASNAAHSPCGNFPSSLPSADWRIYCYFILYVSVELFVEALRHRTNHMLKHSELCVHKALWPFMQKWIKQSQAFMTLDVVKYCDHVCNVLWLLIRFMLHYTVYFTLWWLTAALMMHNVLSVLQHIMPVDCRYGLRTKCYWSFFYFRAALLV